MRSAAVLSRYFQAIIRHAKHDDKEEEHKKVIKELNEKEQKEFAEKRSVSSISLD